MTFPGIIDEPGSFSGKFNSPNPDLGPLPKNLISFAIFINEQAKVFKDPWNSTNASLHANDSNLFGAVTNLYPVSLEISDATASANPLYVFNPVPTAVPPYANSLTAANLLLTLSIPFLTYYAYPPNSYPKVTGVAS